jgi:hypothetical protein
VKKATNERRNLKLNILQNDTALARLEQDVQLLLRSAAREPWWAAVALTNLPWRIATHLADDDLFDLALSASRDAKIVKYVLEFLPEYIANRLRDADALVYSVAEKD